MSVGAIVALSVVGTIVFLAVVFVGWVVATYNKFVKLRNNVDEGFSTMDVYLKKRYDLIPNLCETVKGYAKHENETLQKVMEARYQAMSANDPEDKAKKENVLTGTLKTLFNVTENYPELKADRNFTEMMNTLKALEAEILNSRKYYNAVAKEYNVKREVFPGNIIAKWFKFEKRTLYEVDEPEERKNVKVQF